MIARCEHCLLTKELAPNQGEWLCGDCLWAQHMDHVHNEGMTFIEDGKVVTVTPGTIRPRARQR